MSHLNVDDVSRIAQSAAREESSDLHVAGVTLGAGGGDYVEVILNIHGCRRDPCQVALGVFRNVSESALRAEITEQLRRHLREHRG